MTYLIYLVLVTVPNLTCLLDTLDLVNPSNRVSSINNSIRLNLSGSLGPIRMTQSVRPDRHY